MGKQKNPLRTVSKKALLEQARHYQQHGAIIARIVNAFMLERNSEPITFSAERLEEAKSVDIRFNARPDGSLELMRARAEELRVG